jgi:hypothetical protein
MTQTRTPTEATARRMKHRRIKRGIVASYIHQISGRHSENAARKEHAVIVRAQEKAA